MANSAATTDALPAIAQVGLLAAAFTQNRVALAMNNTQPVPKADHDGTSIALETGSRFHTVNSTHAAPTSNNTNGSGPTRRMLSMIAIVQYPLKNYPHIDSSDVKAEQLAHIISEVFAPWVLNIAFFLILGAVTGGWVPAVIAAVCTGVIPMLLILILMRMGRVGDHHVTSRQQRSLVYIGIISCVIVLVVLLAALQTPRLIWVGVLSALVFLVVFGLVTTRIKASVHVGLWICLIIFLGLTINPWWFLGVVFTPVAAWARIEIKHHTIPEISAGVLAGALVTTLCYGIFLA